MKQLEIPAPNTFYPVAVYRDQALCAWAKESRITRNFAENRRERFCGGKTSLEYISGLHTSSVNQRNFKAFVN